MLKDIFFSALALQTQQVELCTFQVGGLQRKSEATCCLKAFLPFLFMRPGTAMHLVLTDSCRKAAENVTNQILLLPTLPMTPLGMANKFGVLMRANFSQRDRDFFQRAKWKASCNCISVILSTPTTQGQNCSWNLVIQINWLRVTLV